MAHLALSGSQSQRMIWFILPAHGAGHIIKSNISTFVWSNFRSIQRNIVLIENALRGDLVIPEFNQLTKPIEEIYNKCKENKDGKVMFSN